MTDLITVENGVPTLRLETARQIAQLEKKAQYIKEQENELKEAICKAMEASGILKIDTDDLRITYVAPTDREKLDSKALKEDFPELYDTYVTMSPVKASVRIKVK